MRVKFDITGSVEKMTGFNKLEGKGNIDAHFELEFSADELGMVYEFQKNIIPEVLGFIKEIKQEEDNKISDLERNRLESRNESLEIQLEGEKERHVSTQKERDEYFEKYIKSLDEMTNKHIEERKDLEKENEKLRQSLGIKE